MGPIIHIPRTMTMKIKGPIKTIQGCTVGNVNTIAIDMLSSLMQAKVDHV